MKKCNDEVARIECHILMSEAIRGFGDKELQCAKLFQIREYKNKLSEDVYSKIEKFVDEVIHPLVFDVDYFSWLKDSQYGAYNKDGHYIVDSHRSLEMILMKKYFHIQELLEKLNAFAFDELHLDYDC